MKYKAIFCDADGVLIKSKDLFAEELKKEYGINRETLQPFFMGVFADCRIGKADMKLELAKVLADWGWKGSVEELMQFWFTKGTQIDAETIVFVRSLREAGLRCFLTTDQENYRGESLRETLGNGNPFERVFTSAQLGCTKKDPAFFERAYETINQASRNLVSEIIPRDQVLIIDDGEKNIEVAKELGFATHLYINLEGLEKSLAE